MRKWTRAVAIVAALGLAAPGWAGTKDDAKDTATEKKAEGKKALRDAKPGDKTAGDRVEDAKDTATAKTAKAKKKARRGAQKAKRATEQGVKDTDPGTTPTPR